MVRLLQGLSSRDATITQILIVSRFTETDGSYIDYLLLPQVVTVLCYLENHNRRT